MCLHSTCHFAGVLRVRQQHGMCVRVENERKAAVRRGKSHTGLHRAVHAHIGVLHEDLLHSLKPQKSCC